MSTIPMKKYIKNFYKCSMFTPECFDVQLHPVSRCKLQKCLISGVQIYILVTYLYSHLTEAFMNLTCFQEQVTKRRFHKNCCTCVLNTNQNQTQDTIAKWVISCLQPSYNGLESHFGMAFFNTLEILVNLAILGMRIVLSLINKAELEKSSTIQSARRIKVSFYNNLQIKSRELFIM